MAESLLKSKQKFIVRALTRNPESESAQELAKLGAQVVKADGHSDEDMVAALTGAWGFWLNTHHHDPVSPSRRIGGMGNLIQVIGGHDPRRAK